MEVAKVTSKGQITIPISIRRNLGINEGDKVLFISKADGVLMVNPNTFQDDYVAEVENTVSAAESAVPKQSIETPIAPPRPVAATVPDEGAAVKINDVPEVAEPVQKVVNRPVPPPVEEPDKPDTVVGDFNLSTLLDDIRSIGSNI